MDHPVPDIAGFTVYSLSDGIFEKEWLWYFDWMCILHVLKLGNIAVVSIEFMYELADTKESDVHQDELHKLQHGMGFQYFLAFEE